MFVLIPKSIYWQYLLKLFMSTIETPCWAVDGDIFPTLVHFSSPSESENCRMSCQGLKSKTLLLRVTIRAPYIGLGRAPGTSLHSPAEG